VIFADFPFSLMFGSIFEKWSDGTYMGHIHNTSLPCNLQMGPMSYLAPQKAEKACQGQKIMFIGPICKLQRI
jgi:hypothetical protein